MNKISVIAAIGLSAISIAGASGAPVPASVGSLDSALPGNATAVRYWHRHWHGGGWGYPYGAAVGFGWGWGWPGYYAAAPYDPYYYGPPVVYEAAPPIYTAPPPARTRSGAARQCWVDTDSSRGYGYWQPC
ncbi:MAG TPA: hypothetical protein VHD59_11490 [Pseudolabrys sp.]|jgi:hypothetical protein|nr:hypothetical protein [Pseudolabrys sp.]